jgi:hypothetical protein
MFYQSILMPVETIKFSIVKMIDLGNNYTLLCKGFNSQAISAMSLKCHH